MSAGSRLSIRCGLNNPNLMVGVILFFRKGQPEVHFKTLHHMPNIKIPSASVKNATDFDEFFEHLP